MPGVGELLALRKSASREICGGEGQLWGHGPRAGGGCHHAALVTSVTSLAVSCPQALGCPRAVGRREAGWGCPGRRGGLPMESSQLWARFHPQPCLAAFTSHLDQTQPSELPGHPQAGREQAPAACSVWSRPSCALSVCLSVLLRAPAPLCLGGVLARGSISSFLASPQQLVVRLALQMLWWYS